MSLDALDQYHGTQISTGKFPAMCEKNKGLPKLDPQEEYVFELIERDAKPGKGISECRGQSRRQARPGDHESVPHVERSQTGNLCS